MKPNILCFSSGSLTGYGVIHGIQAEFLPENRRLADTESIGSIDAPESIAAGAMRSSFTGWKFGSQQFISRPWF